jgi:hypothetical protein
MMYLGENDEVLPLVSGLRSCKLSRAVGLTVSLLEEEGAGEEVVGER